MTLTLRPDQTARLVHFIQQPKTMDLSDPGTGKTPSVVVNQFRRYHDDAMKTIWVMPKSLMAKNRDEICRFTPFSSEDVAILDGPIAKRRKLLAEEKPILLTGPDAFRIHWNKDEIPSAYRGLDVDEFHMCFAGKAYDAYGFGSYTLSARATAFLAAAPRMKEMVLMSGTMINGRLDSAYPAIAAIEPRYYPMGVRDFMAHHAVYDFDGNLERWTNHERIRTIFGNHGIRFTFESIFGEQEVIRELHWLEMSEKQRELYDQFKEQAFLELEEFLVNGTEPGVATMRARQIMEHPTRFPDLRFPGQGKFVDITDGEPPAKAEFLDLEIRNAWETKTPLIVFSSLVPQVHYNHERWSNPYVPTYKLTGEIPQSTRSGYDRDFRADGGLMFATPAVSSVGYNWQIAGGKEVETVIFQSLPYMDTQFIQGYRRAIRGKRTKPLRVITLAYKDSVDAKIMAILRRKSLDANKVDPTLEVVRFNDHSEDF